MRAGLRLLEQESKENQEKLSTLRSLAFEAFDRGERSTLVGEQQLADFMGGLGRRAAKRAGSSSGSR